MRSLLDHFEIRVRDLDLCRRFYTDVLGLEVSGVDGDRVELGPRGGAFTVELVGDPDATPRPYPCVGLYHIAYLVPDRAALGGIMRRVQEAEVPWEGMADHAVSEALYLRDPEMNGIELYRDRPMGEWPTDASGDVMMGADPIDVAGVLAAASSPAGLHPGTVVGHVHHHVRSIEEGEAFYGGVLGLGVRQRSYVGALFLARGDYHHHVGLNIWAPRDIAPPGSTGLVSYRWRMPSEEVEAIESRAGDAGRLVDGELRLVDPAGIGVRVVAL